MIEDTAPVDPEPVGEVAVDLSSTRQRILLGAAGLFREHGYGGTTTRQLSAMAGIRNASLYHHVGGKEDLLYGLCLGAIEDSAKLFSDYRDADDPMAALEELAHAYVVLALRDRDRHATMLTETRSLSPAHRDELARLRDVNFAVVQDLAAAAQQRGQLRSDISAKYLTLAMFNMLNWTIFWFDPDGELSPDQIGEILGSIFFGGAATGSGAPGSISDDLRVWRGGYKPRTRGTHHG
jgi:TetR/AcrR family transcriptional regulator, cholesterol catabolism regulator